MVMCSHLVWTRFDWGNVSVTHKAEWEMLMNWFWLDSVLR